MIRVATGRTGQGASQAGRAGQDGYALLMVLTVLLIASLLVTVMATLWVRGAVRAVQYGDGTAAFYAAEAGLSRMLQVLAEEGGPAGSVQELSGTVDPEGGPASYQVRVEPAGLGRWTLVSTGRQGRAERTVRLSIVAPLALPMYAGERLDLQTVAKGELNFSAPPAYGQAFSTSGSGDVTPAPVKDSIPLPDIPFGAFASLAGAPPAQAPSLDGSGGTLAGGWYDAGRGNCPDTGRHLRVPAGATAGIAGDVDCPNAVLTLAEDATLVVTGSLRVATLVLEEGARLVTGDTADIQHTVALEPVSSPPARPVLVVVGGALAAKAVEPAGDGAREPDPAAVPPLAILALDRSDCGAAPCGPDGQNQISVADLAVPRFLIYAEPLPGGTSSADLRLWGGQGSKADENGQGKGQGKGGQGGDGNKGGTDGQGKDGGRGGDEVVQVAGAVVAAGNVDLWVHRNVDWTMDFDLLRQFTGVLPPSALYVVETWRESP